MSHYLLLVITNSRLRVEVSTCMHRFEKQSICIAICIVLGKIVSDSGRKDISCFCAGLFSGSRYLIYVYATNPTNRGKIQARATNFRNFLSCRISLGDLSHGSFCEEKKSEREWEGERLGTATGPLLLSWFHLRNVYQISMEAFAGDYEAHHPNFAFHPDTVLAGITLL